MKKGSIILIFLSIAALIISGGGIYFSVSEYQKSEELYNEAKQCYADADTLCRPYYGVTEKSDDKTNIRVPKEFASTIIPQVEIIEKVDEQNGDVLYTLSNDNATAFCDSAKQKLKDDFKENCCTSDFISGFVRAEISTNLDEVTYYLDYSDEDALAAITDVYLLSLRNDKIESYSRLIQAFNGEYERDLITNISYYSSEDNEQIFT